MNVAVIDRREALSDYIVEMFRTWGLTNIDAADAPDPQRHDVVIVPATDVDAGALIAFTKGGGTVIALMPGKQLAEAAGLTLVGDKELPACLRMATFAPPGGAGEMLPIVGSAKTYERNESARVMGYLCYPDRYEDEHMGITETMIGRGRIIVIAFDLPRCVMLMRQGDPANAEKIPPVDACARPSHLASRYDARDAGWMPHADLLARLLVDLAIAFRAQPTPLIDHLPDAQSAIVLYSGDEDYANVAWNDQQQDFLARHGARMDLYIIPEQTQSSPEDIKRYAARHDLGPHPNIRPLDGKPVAERCADMERQIKLFEQMAGIQARTLRNHCTAWAGYMEHVETLERCGVRMEASYTSSSYMRNRNHAPYASFGGAMPMRFCRSDGRLINVFQQHTHVMDDVWFAPDEGRSRKTTYSYRFDADTFRVMLRRMLDDCVTRFNTPLTNCIHPSNWVVFSREQGQAFVLESIERNIPIWSFTQWSMFWDARDTWSCEDTDWQNGRLTFTMTGHEDDDRLHVQLPCAWQDRRLERIVVNDDPVEPTIGRRHGREVALIPLRRATVAAQYE